MTFQYCCSIASSSGACCRPGYRGADDADDYSRAIQDHDGGVPESEKARGKAEKGPGIADRAYRESLGLTAPEFVDLRRIEVQKEIVQHSPAALTVIMGLELVGINLPPLAGGN
jgi:hypothetical protein